MVALFYHVNEMTKLLIASLISIIKKVEIITQYNNIA